MAEHKITLDEFNVLAEYERNLGDTAKDFLRMSDSDYMAVTASLINKGYLADNKITDAGRSVLEPYKVSRAIFMAAGMGSRMVPLTYVVPKPLVVVCEKRIIETILDAVIEAGIEEVYLVRGYMGEAFNMLKEKYPMIRFIDNPYYKNANNISSAYVIRDMMAHAYVIESDLVLYNPRIIRKYEYSTNYLGRKTDYTDDWCFKVNEGFVKELLVGGNDVYHMYGISYWNAEDAAKMSVDIATVFEAEDGKQKYWDEVSMRDCKSHYNIMVKPVYEGDIVEIDSFKELQEIDSRYCIG